MDQQEQMQFFYEIFDPSLPRLGPGEDASTHRALDIVRSHSKQVKNILDIGCGNGAQTLQLARSVSANILAVDNHQPFLDELKRRAAAEELTGNITARRQDMSELKATETLFDVIWCEGAIYIIGFRRGLNLFLDLLSPAGTVAITELCWLRPDVPDECRNYFERECPFIMTVEGNLQMIGECGYRSIGHFVLPEAAWWTPFYNPLLQRIIKLRNKYPSDKEKLQILRTVEEEVNIYKRFSKYYGYVFFIVKPS